MSAWRLTERSQIASTCRTGSSPTTALLRQAWRRVGSPRPRSRMRRHPATRTSGSATPTGFNPATYTLLSRLEAPDGRQGTTTGPFSKATPCPTGPGSRTSKSGLTTASRSSGTPRRPQHAIDYLKSYNATIAGADPCLSLSGLPAALCTGSPSTTPIPADTFMQASADWIANGGVQDPGVFTMFGGNTMSTSGYTNPATYTGDTSTSITVFFRATSTDAVLAWGGHIASRATGVSLAQPFRSPARPITCGLPVGATRTTTTT